MDIFLKIKNKNNLSLFLLFISLFLLILLQFHNVILHPIRRGFDAIGHIAYINYVKNYWQVPLPYQGFLFYHQPLYYIITALFPSLRMIKIFGSLLWILLGWFLFKFLKKHYKETITSLISTIVIMSIPVFLYQSISISNEFLSTFLIIVALIYYLSYSKRGKTKNWLILGFLTGLAIFTKATGLILIPTIFLSEIIVHFTSKKKKSHLYFLFIFLLTAFIIGGGIYLRNWLLFANPLIAGTDFPKIFPLNQPVVSRNLHFFLNLSSFTKLDMFQAQHYSFLGGTLFSFFYDGHNVVVPVQPFSKIGALVIFFSFPLLISSIIGFCQSKDKLGKEIVLPIFSFLLISAYIFYNFKFPFYSTVKGSFIASLALPYGYYFSKFIDRHRKYIFIFSIFILTYVMILIKAFWIKPGWY